MRRKLSYPVLSQLHPSHNLDWCRFSRLPTAFLFWLELIIVLNVVRGKVARFSLLVPWNARVSSEKRRYAVKKSIRHGKRVMVHSMESNLESMSILVEREDVMHAQ